LVRALADLVLTPSCAATSVGVCPLAKRAQTGSRNYVMALAPVFPGLLSSPQDPLNIRGLRVVGRIGMAFPNA
jgi:hypothetical protein